MAILLPGKNIFIFFKSFWDKKRTLHIEKYLIDLQNIKIMNIYTHNNRASKYIRKTLTELKRNKQFYNNFRDFNSLLSITEQDKISIRKLGTWTITI